MNKKIAFFDFDGTITFNDSVKGFYNFVYRRSYLYHYYIKNIYHVLLCKFRFINYATLKKRRLHGLVNKYSKTFIENKSSEFYVNFLKKDLKKDALDEIKFLKDNNFEIIIVSASYNILLKEFCKEYSLGLVTNDLEIKNNKFNGECINKLDCNFGEKVSRIKRKFNLKDYNEIYVYGDSEGDMEMMKIGTKNFYNKFKG
tara:strand:+ start:4060 stop:4659 length:600 start_codon:yes stop_codon:yes gene_type:complete